VLVDTLWVLHDDHAREQLDTDSQSDSDHVSCELSMEEAGWIVSEVIGRNLQLEVTVLDSVAAQLEALQERLSAGEAMWQERASNFLGAVFDYDLSPDDIPPRCLMDWLEDHGDVRIFASVLKDIFGKDEDMSWPSCLRSIVGHLARWDKHSMARAASFVWEWHSTHSRRTLWDLMDVLSGPWWGKDDRNARACKRTLKDAMLALVEAAEQAQHASSQAESQARAGGRNARSRLGR